jgi:hypothetical protein
MKDELHQCEAVNCMNMNHEGTKSGERCRSFRTKKVGIHWLCWTHEQAHLHGPRPDVFTARSGYAPG